MDKSTTNAAAGQGIGVHGLKTWPEYFKSAADGSRMYEIRRFDRTFHVGDLIRLGEWAAARGYTGAFCDRVVTHLVLPADLTDLTGFADRSDMKPLGEGYCLLALKQATLEQTDLISRRLAGSTIGLATQLGPNLRYSWAAADTGWDPARPGGDVTVYFAHAGGRGGKTHALLEATIAALGTKLDRQIRDVDDRLNGTATDMVERDGRLSARISEVQGDVKGLKNRVATLETEDAELLSTLRTHGGQIRKLEEKTTDTTDEVIGQIRQLEGFKAVSDRVLARVTELEAKHGDLDKFVTANSGAMFMRDTDLLARIKVLETKLGIRHVERQVMIEPKGEPPASAPTVEVNGQPERVMSFGMSFGGYPVDNVLRVLDIIADACKQGGYALAANDLLSKLKGEA